MKCDNMYTCTVIIITVIIISIVLIKKYYNKGENNKEEITKGEKNEYYYPNYPYIYQHQDKRKLTSGLHNYKLDDRGGMYVWVSTPTMPIYIPCRKSKKYNDMCKYVIGNTKPFISST